MPIPPSTMPEPIEEILAYIRQNKDKYTREAIDQHLKDAGWGQQDIDLAWQRISAEGALTTPTSPPLAACIMYILFLVGGIVVCVVTLLIPGATESEITGYGHSAVSSDVLQKLTTFKNIYYGIVFLFVLLVMVTAPPLHRVLLRRGWNSRMIVTLVLVLYFVWIAIVTGYCVYGPGIVSSS